MIGKEGRVSRLGDLCIPHPVTCELCVICIFHKPNMGAKPHYLGRTVISQDPNQVSPPLKPWLTTLPANMNIRKQRTSGQTLVVPLALRGIYQ